MHGSFAKFVLFCMLYFILQALLSRHNRLDKDIRAFNIEIKRLEELAVLMTKAASEHNVSAAYVCGSLYKM